MQIKAMLLQALSDRDPQQFSQLNRSGQLENWAQTRLSQANDLYNQLTASEDKLPNGVVRSPSARLAAEEQAIALVMDGLTDDVPQLPPTTDTALAR
jgi:hypothetical protein